MKKLTTLIAALVMVFSMSAAVFCADSASGVEPMISYDGVIYKLSGFGVALEIPVGAEFISIGEATYVDGTPIDSGTQNYSSEPVKFALGNCNGVDGLFAYYDGDYCFFEPCFTISESGVPEAVPAPTSYGESAPTSEEDYVPVPVPVEPVEPVEHADNPTTGVAFPAATFTALLLLTGCLAKRG